MVANDFGSALFGVGDGIRHRAGGEMGLGAELPVYVDGDLSLFAGIDATAKLFPDDLGPMLYVGGGATFGVGYAL